VAHLVADGLRLEGGGKNGKSLAQQQITAKSYLVRPVNVKGRIAGSQPMEDRGFYLSN
jgi:hypothetical protein